MNRTKTNKSLGKKNIRLEKKMGVLTNPDA